MLDTFLGSVVLISTTRVLIFVVFWSEIKQIVPVMCSEQKLLSHLFNQLLNQWLYEFQHTSAQDLSLEGPVRQNIEQPLQIIVKLLPIVFLVVHSGQHVQERVLQVSKVWQLEHLTFWRFGLTLWASLQKITLTEEYFMFMA